MAPSPSWSEQYRARKAVEGRFGRIHDLPIVRRLTALLLSEAPAAGTLLEVGAGGRALCALLARERPGLAYVSADPDPAGAHDHRSLEEVPGTYDVVAAFEVVEHVERDALDGFLAALAARVKPGGCLVLSTPNVYYPPDVLRDASHVTPLCYDELGGYVERAGLGVTRLVRVYHDALLRKLLRRYVFGWLFRLLGLDFARQVAVVARRPHGA